MKRTLTFALLGFFLLAACQSAATTTPPASTSTAAPSPKPTAIPSPSPAPTAAPTATLVPAPRTFTEEFDATLPNWASFQVNNTGLDQQIQNGYLVFILTAPNDWVYSLYTRQDYKDVRVDARADNRSKEPAALGIVCRYSETDGWYEFNIYTDQTYMLLYGQGLKDGMARYVPLYRGQSEKIRVGGEANEIGLLCQGNILTPYINGVQMRKWEEQKFGLTNGKIGVSASAFENLPIVAGFDWVKVSEP
ncbi:MAG: hypothetical protein HYX49_09340 [Chloroflexi bacterium]|nr:hypothetical protein [Chloroflexota bacterium]